MHNLKSGHVRSSIPDTSGFQFSNCKISKKSDAPRFQFRTSDSHVTRCGICLKRGGEGSRNKNNPFKVTVGLQKIWSKFKISLLEHCGCDFSELALERVQFIFIILEPHQTSQRGSPYQKKPGARCQS